MENSTQNKTVRIPKYLLDKIKAEAKKHGISQRALIIMALTEYLARNK